MAFDAYDDYEQGERVQQWLRQNGLSIVVGIVIGLVAIFGWQQWRKHQVNHQAAASQLYVNLRTAQAAGQTDQANALPGLGFLPPKLQQDWASWLADPTADERRERLRSMETNMLKIVAEMERQGADLLISASDGTYVIPGFSLHEEVKLYRKAGVSPRTILESATWNAARFFGQENEWGCIQVGLCADLVLLDANPLADSANLSAVSAVIVGGEHFSKAELDAGLERIRQGHQR